MCLVSNVYRVAGKWIWEVFERKAELGVLFGFFPPFLKKTNKRIPRSLLLLPFKGCIFVSFFTFVDLVLVLAVLSTIFYCKKYTCPKINVSILIDEKAWCKMKTRSRKLSSRVAIGACPFWKDGGEHCILLFLVETINFW